MIRQSIPNTVTILNLLSGSLAIIFVFQGNLALASWLIGLAALFDFLDGLLARLLNAMSPIGKELDSLADVISFGLAPGIIVFHLMQHSYNPPFLYWMDINVWTFVALLLPAFSALRLAVFNIDTRQSDAFIGLPTPANALFFAAFPLVILQAGQSGYQGILELLRNYWFLAGVTVVFSLLLVSPLRLFSLKFKNYSLRQNLLRYNFLIISIAAFLLLKFFALPLIVVLYILLSVAIPEKRETKKDKS
ncbi:MAG: CDP-diacylglycerol--serine O-phosphatidyltransferase [Bacteroidales bacterium]